MPDFDIDSAFASPRPEAWNYRIEVKESDVDLYGKWCLTYDGADTDIGAGALMSHSLASFLDNDVPWPHYVRDRRSFEEWFPTAHRDLIDSATEVFEDKLRGHAHDALIAFRRLEEQSPYHGGSAHEWRNEVHSQRL